MDCKKNTLAPMVRLLLMLWGCGLNFSGSASKHTKESAGVHFSCDEEMVVMMIERYDDEAHNLSWPSQNWSRFDAPEVVV